MIVDSPDPFRPWSRAAALLLLVGLSWQAKGEVTFELRLVGERKEISPLIYGLNDWFRDERSESINYTLERMGGNRMTGYNWENNFSNAGSDYIHHSDGGLVSSAEPEDRRNPGQAVKLSVDHARSGGRPSLVTLQLAGYVAADGDGVVSESEAAPSSRWKKVEIRKEGELSLSPDTADDFVYLDEQVNFLVATYGLSSEGGIFGYSLDNEPSVWPYTHARIHPELPTVAEIVELGAECAEMVKELDPNALIFGPALYGYGAYVDFSAPDWSSYEDEYDWFLSAYLGEMRKRSEVSGRRLLDVLDIHYYPEVAAVTGEDGEGNEVYTRITDNSNNHAALAEARIQAPRSLWDATYVEESWITTWSTGGEPIRLLPRVFQSIDTHNPGTKLSISEYDYGGRQNYSGGLAQADALGIYGREGLYAACFWGDVEGYIAPAFKLYRDYDGQGSTFGDLSVQVSNPDAERYSCYASVDRSTSSVHVVALNKTSVDQEATVDFSQDGLLLEGMRAFGFSEESGPQIVAMGSVEERFSGSVKVALPARSAVHYVFGSPGIEYDTLLIQGGDREGTVTALYRPSVGPARSLKESEDLGVWSDLIEEIPGDGLVRKLELKPDGSVRFWRIAEKE